MKISVFGIGYVGLSNALLLAQKHEVIAVDINKERVDSVKKGVSPIKDDDIERFLKLRPLNAQLTSEFEAYDSDYYIIATPTNYDPISNSFDTSSVDSVLRQLALQKVQGKIIIKSTIPVGYTEIAKKKYPLHIIFVPEFLREGQALHDNLYPSRIVVGGGKSGESEEIAHIFLSCALKEAPVLLTSSTEAECIKLFSNTYLAMRVAFFNELDTFCLEKGMSTEDIVKGICMDPRIDFGYNNPSFGYGGYCLPKDTKQLLSNYGSIPQSLIKGIIQSNRQRKDFIVDSILRKKPRLIGIYKLAMKSNSDNYRNSAILGVIKRLKNKGVTPIIYDPALQVETFMECNVLTDRDQFFNMVDLIVANRWDDVLRKYSKKVFCRDIFGDN